MLNKLIAVRFHHPTPRKECRREIQELTGESINSPLKRGRQEEADNSLFDRNNLEGGVSVSDTARTTSGTAY
jgi:hypothetical protein